MEASGNNLHKPHRPLLTHSFRGDDDSQKKCKVKLPEIPISSLPASRSAQALISPRQETSPRKVTQLLSPKSSRRADEKKEGKEEGEVKKKYRSRSFTRGHLREHEKELHNVSQTASQNTSQAVSQKISPLLALGNKKINELKSSFSERNLTIEYQSNRECKEFNQGLVEVLNNNLIYPESLSLEGVQQLHEEFWPKSVKENTYDVDLLKIFRTALLGPCIHQAIIFQERLTDYKNTKKIGSPFSNAIFNLLEELIGPPSKDKTIETCPLNFSKFIGLRTELKNEQFKPARKSLRHLIPYKKKKVWEEILKHWVGSGEITQEEKEKIKEEIANITPDTVLRTIIPENSKVYMDIEINDKFLFRDSERATASKVFTAILTTIYEDTLIHFESIFESNLEKRDAIQYQVNIFLVLASESPNQVEIQQELVKLLTDKKWVDLKSFFKEKFSCSCIDWGSVEKKWNSRGKHPKPLVKWMSLMMPAFEILQGYTISAHEPFRRVVREELAKMEIDFSTKCISAIDSDYRQKFTLSIKKSYYSYSRSIQIGIYPADKVRNCEKLATFNYKAGIQVSSNSAFDPIIDCESLVFTKVRVISRDGEEKDYTEHLIHLIEGLRERRFYPRMISISSAELRERIIQGPPVSAEK